MSAACGGYERRCLDGAVMKKEKEMSNHVCLSEHLCRKQVVIGGNPSLFFILIPTSMDHFVEKSEVFFRVFFLVIV